MREHLQPTLVCAFFSLVSFVAWPSMRSAQAAQEAGQSHWSTADLAVLYAGFIGAFGGIAGGLVGARLTLRAARKDRQDQLITDLQREFEYGEMMPVRLKAEQLLHPHTDVNNPYRTFNFKQMFDGRMPFNDYANVSSVLNFFRLINDYKERGQMDEDEGRKAFHWMYKWWWENVIQHYSQGMANEQGWEKHIKKYQWLLDPPNWSRFLHRT